MSKSSVLLLTPLVLWTLLMLMPCPTLSYTVADEEQLRTAITSGYMKGVRPNGTVSVQVSFQLTSIINVDLKGQILSIAGWWFLSWDDSRLTWSPQTYGAIGITTFYEDELWNPALVVSNSLNDLSAIQEGSIPMRVYFDGRILWQPPGILKVSCEMDPTFFPFDKQTCAIEVTSFGFTIDEVGLYTNIGIMMYYYQENGEWEIISSETTVESYSDNNLNYGKLRFELVLQRRPSFYWLNVLFPIMVNGVLAMFLFILPADSGEKMGYSLTVLLTYVVLMTLLSSGMPTSAKHTSLLEVYISLILGFSAVTILLAIINLSLYHKEEGKPVPVWLKSLVNQWSSPCCHGNDQDRGNAEKGERKGKLYSSGSKTKVYPHVEKNSTVFHRSHKSKNEDSTEPEDNSSPDVTWKQVSAAMDQVCFRIYFIINLTLMIVFIPMLMFGA